MESWQSYLMGNGSMKIGIFSDVHGHLDELHKTLDLLESHQVNQIICAGDLVDKGAYSDGVIDLIRTLGIPCVMGNHDAKAQYMWLTDNEPLQDRSLAYLKTLPESLVFEWAEFTVYLCHSNPWHDASVYVYPTRPEILFKLVADDVNADIIVMGHTHHPMHVQIDHKCIINPGSIYGNRDRNERTCGILSLPESTFEIYDIESGNQLPVSSRKVLY